MNVNQKIKQELQIRGWSQYQLSKVTGIEQSTISKWFQVVPTSPSPKSIKKVAKAFEMTVGQLVDEKFEPDEQTKELQENWNRLNKEEKKCILLVIRTIIQHR